jgi:hypothetical protein
MTSSRARPAGRAILALLAAIAMSACSGVTLTPVDHGCASNPQINEGSGCGHGSR